MFDFDGTLAYTQGKNLSVYQEVFAELGEEGVTQEEYAANIGQPIEHHVRHIAECHGMDMTDADIIRTSRRFMEISNAYNARHTPPMYRYVPIALSHLSDATCLVVTANRHDHVNRVLRAWGIRDRFEGIVMVGGTDGPCDKREAYGLALRQVTGGSDGSRAVVFEDSPQCISLARGLGMATVGIVHPSSGNRSARHADFRIDVTEECQREG
jgi:beta-phosphoglucomutase-like phosphatase (HAD superfamily)